jgi:hypothetical protein
MGLGRVMCIGTLHGPAGDCLLPITGALLCYGYLDRDEARPLRESIEGPRPLLFPACSVHRAALVDWAEHLWGQIADGTWVPPEAIPRVVEWMRAEHDPVVLSPDPADAVAIQAS